MILRARYIHTLFVSLSLPPYVAYLKKKSNMTVQRCHFFSAFLIIHFPPLFFCKHSLSFTPSLFPSPTCGYNFLIYSCSVSVLKLELIHSFIAVNALLVMFRFQCFLWIFHYKALRVIKSAGEAGYEGSSITVLRHPLVSPVYWIQKCVCVCPCHKRHIISNRKHEHFYSRLSHSSQLHTFSQSCIIHTKECVYFGIFITPVHFNQ